MNRRTKICCLPIAGMENPYQFLMMEGLRKDEHVEVLHGAPGKLFAALRTCLKYRPDYLHYDWNYSYFLRRHALWTWINSPLFLLELLIVKHIFGCRIMWTMHNIRSHDRPPSRLERLVQQVFARMCDWIRVFSESSSKRAAEYLKIDPGKFKVVPEGSYVGYYPDFCSMQEARDKLKIGLGEFVLVYFGAIRPYKGIEELIETFKRMPHEKWRLIIAGPPRSKQYADEIESRAKADTRIATFMDLIPKDEVQYFFKACDVVVFPFREIENSGSVILAMGFAKPVVAPALGILPERLRQQLTLVYRPGHLYEALERLKGMDRETLGEIGRQNLEEVERYRWEDFAELFVGDNEGK